MDKQITVSRHYTRKLRAIQPKALDASNMRIMQNEGFGIYRGSTLLHMMVRAAMGSGKTKFVKYAMAAQLHNDDALRCLCVVPTCNIGNGYAEENVLSYPDEYDIPDIPWKINSKEFFTDNKSDVFTKFVQWLNKPNLSEIERRGVISHVTFARLIDEGYGYLLNHIIINIDEVHHSAHDGDNGNNLGTAVNYLLENSVSQDIGLIFTTATPSRTDSFKLIGDDHQTDFVEYEYNFAQYLEDTKYVKGYDYNILPSPDNWLKITENNQLIKRGDKVIVFMPGEGHTSVTKKPAEQNVRDWIRSVSDKNTRIKFDDNGICVVTIRGVAYRILNLVEGKYQQKGLKYIDKNPDSVDIILNVKIYAEGSNWTPANKAIIYGQRGSIVQLIQSIGRIFRDHEKKVGKRSVVNIIHVLPHINLKRTGKDSYNNMLKAINIALLFKSVNLPLDYVILNKGKVKKCRKFNHIEALREELPDIDNTGIYDIIEDMGNIVVSEHHICGLTMNNMEFNVHIMKRVTDMLIGHGVTKQATKIAEMLVLTNLHERRLSVMKNLTNIDVSQIDYDIISEYSVADVFMCDMQPKKFWKWYSEEYCGGEELAIETLNDYIARVKRGEKPSTSSPDPIEKLCADRINRYRIAFNNPSSTSSASYPILKKMAAFEG